MSMSSPAARLMVVAACSVHSPLSEVQKPSLARFGSLFSGWQHGQLAACKLKRISPRPGASRGGAAARSTGLKAAASAGQSHFFLTFPFPSPPLRSASDPTAQPHAPSRPDSKQLERDGMRTTVGPRRPRAASEPGAGRSDRSGPPLRGTPRSRHAPPASSRVPHYHPVTCPETSSYLLPPPQAAASLDGRSRKLLQASPPPVAAAYPCAVGDAVCLCKWKAATGTFADVAVGCQVR